MVWNYLIVYEQKYIGMNNKYEWTSFSYILCI